ncbi:hypothetical protein MNBD_PLANCTO02-869 [hydrothermal vent metagenome]|uniref:Gamma-butyrobetaine hydroxylase-like N-terminal domain-containing protein n=1 Tax=hydrothermal vent metagenome TaxID=652676 RepID=A0A3B1D9L6_9ZZZZ
MAVVPSHIKAHQKDGELELQWADSSACRLKYTLLRGECPCANCISEHTGERLLDLTTIPEEIHPTKIQLTGNYALQIFWSDNHNTGMYTWEHLMKLCQS